MPGPANERLPRLQNGIERKRLSDDLRRGICIGSVYGQTGDRSSVELQFRAMRQGLVHVNVLAAKGSARAEKVEVNLVAKKVVEINCRSRVFFGKFLLDSGFKRPRSLRFQAGIWRCRKPSPHPERLREAWLFDALGVGKPKPGAGKELSAAQRCVSKGNAGNNFV